MYKNKLQELNFSQSWKLKLLELVTKKKLIYNYSVFLPVNYLCNIGIYFCLTSRVAWEIFLFSQDIFNLKYNVAIYSIDTVVYGVLFYQIELNTWLFIVSNFENNKQT